MMLQFDLFSYLRFTFSSVFANFVVVAILAGMLAMVVGLAYMCMNRRDGITILAYGGILVGIFIALAAQQFGAVPVTFDGVAKLGLATFPAGPVMDVYRTATTWLLDKIGWVANLFMFGGGAVFLATRGRNGAAWVIIGAAIMGVGSLIGSGGIVTWIMDYMGVTAPVIS